MKCGNCNIDFKLIGVDLPEVRYLPIEGIAFPLHRDTINGIYKFNFKCPKCNTSANMKIMGGENAQEFYNLQINKPMKNVIEQISKIKGIVTVEKAGENMAIVVFEGREKTTLILCETEQQWNFVVSKGMVAVRSGDFLQRAITFAKYIFDYTLVNEWYAFNKPKSLSPEELVDGRIYASTYIDCVWLMIYRYKSFRENRTDGFTVNCYSTTVNCYSTMVNSDNHIFNDWIEVSTSKGTCRLATPSEAQSLIRAEVANGYFHELK